MKKVSLWDKVSYIRLVAVAFSLFSTTSEILFFINYLNGVEWG